jgi:hypothetical protein
MRVLQSLYLSLLLFAVGSEGEDAEGERYVKYFEACADAAISVEDVSLLCDSPGAYYYGNGKYRDSETCMLGDKGKAKVYFYISEENDGYEPYVTLKVVDDFSSDVEPMYLYQDEALCSISNLKAQDGQACPAEGYYYISGSTYLGEKNGSGNSFDAKTVIGFRTDPEVYNYDLGGANTDLCPGGVFSKYSYGRLRKQVANAVASFFVTWGTLFFGVVAVLGFAVFLMRKIKAKQNPPLEDADEDLLDGHYNQVVVMSSSRSLVDF